MDVVKKQSAFQAAGPDCGDSPQASDRSTAPAERINRRHGTYALVLACRRPVEDVRPTDNDQG